MSTNVGNIDLGLDVNKKTFNKQLKGLGTDALKQTKTQFGGFGKSIGVAMGAGVAIAATAMIAKTAISFTKSCLSLGSNLQEVQNVVDTVFPSMNGQVNNFAQNAMTQFGLSETVAKKYMGTLGAMSKSMGFAETASYNMAEAVTGLAGDVASFYNMSSDEAYTKLKSIWTGETESLKEIGVVMTQTNLDQYALNNGFGKTTKSMTEQEKVMLRYQYVMSSLSASQGDFSKTSGSWANQVRVLSLQFDSFKATLGQGFINLFTPIIKVINILLSKLQILANGFLRITELITGKKASPANIYSGLADSAATASENIAGTGDAAEGAAKKAARALAGFDQITKLSDDTSSSSGGGGGAGGGGGSGLTDSNAIADSLDKATDKASKLSGVLSSIKMLIGKGFNIGFGDSNFDSIKGHIDGIKDSLLGIFTDKAVVASAKTFFINFMLGIGEISGSIASIGSTMAGLLLGGIDLYLNQNSDSVKNHLTTMFDLGSGFSKSISNITVAFADIFTIFRAPEAKQMLADSISIFTDIFLGITELGLEYGLDIFNAFTEPIVNNKDLIKKSFGDLLAPLSVIIGEVKTLVSDTFTTIKDKYDQYVKPAFQELSDGFDAIINSDFADAMKNIKGYLEDIGTSLKPLIDKLQPFLDKLIDEYFKAFASNIQFVGGILKGVFRFLITALEGAIQAFSGLIDFISGVFTGDADKAFTGFFKTVFGIFKTLIGSIISMFGGKDIVNTLETTFDDGVEVIRDAFKNVPVFFTGIWTKITTVFSSVGTWFSTKFSSAWTSITSAFSNCSDFFTAVWCKIVGIFSNVVNWFREQFQGAWNSITTIFNNYWTYFAGIWSGIVGIFSSVGTWFSTQFTNAWNNIKGAFDNVKSFFDGIWNTIKGSFTSIGTNIGNAVSSTFKGVINACLTSIENTINSAIGKINGLISSFNSVVPKSMKISGSIANVNIPKLAQGGYVKANTPQLAMIGDNKHQGEVVAPEDKLNELLAKAVANGGSGLTPEMLMVLKAILSQLKNLNLDVQLDGESIKKNMVKRINQGTQATGVCEILT